MTVLVHSPDHVQPLRCSDQELQRSRRLQGDERPLTEPDCI